MAARHRRRGAAPGSGCEAARRQALRSEGRASVQDLRRERRMVPPDADQGLEARPPRLSDLVALCRDLKAIHRDSGQAAGLESTIAPVGGVQGAVGPVRDAEQDLAAPEHLTPAHDLTAFDCGVPDLDDWLRRRALRNEATGALSPTRERERW